MTAAIMPMKWAEDAKNAGDAAYCACCGRKLASAPVYVEVINGGADVAAPGLGPDVDDAGYMGMYPVGRTCARRYFAGFWQ